MYIAHYRKSDNKHQEVKDHLLNVSKYCMEFGKSIGICKLSELVGLLHDMGKFSDEFQDYIKTAIEHDKNGTLEKWSRTNSTVDHGRVGGIYLYEKFHNMNGYAKITAEITAMAICYHHGGLHDFITFDCKTPLLERLKREKNDTAYNQAVQRFFEQLYSEDYIENLFYEACKEIENFARKIAENKLTRDFSLQLLIKQLYSILIDSDRYDTYLFMDDKEENPAFDVKKLWEQYLEKMDDKIIEFRNKETDTELEEKIKQLRLEISDTCSNFSHNENGIYTLTVPTGGGKTLSSLRFALKHAIERNKKRIIYILPFTTIIEQNAEEIRNVLECGDYLLEHHSNVINDNDIENNCNSNNNCDSNRDIESLDNYRLLTQRWDSPIIFTTMVQFLDTLYAGGTKSLRRMHNLCESILIFDEIQAIPIKCISLFNDAINYLNKICNSTVILCSATQPNLSETKIPLLKNNNGEIIPDLLDKFIGFKRMNVCDKRINGGYTYEMLGDFVYELKEKLSSILIVLNTKTCAEKTYKELIKRNSKKKYNIFYLSTNLCPEHRAVIIKKIKKYLEAKKPVICVSTQLIEAGVNISFEGIIRHLAGMDSIAQATGRGNRHGEASIGNSYIINLKEEKLGSLKEIESGEKHTMEILYEYSNNPENFDYDLLSPKAIRRYYNYYYSDKIINEQMNYPVKVKSHNNIDVNIYDMLSGKVLNKRYYKDKYGCQCELSLNFMFETAGNHFRVIDDLTKSVLVPYGKGKNIIADLFSAKSFEEKLNGIKSVQHYSVNIYDNEMKKLKDQGAFAISEIPGIYVLKEGYYDEMLGVVTEKKMDFLNV